MATPTLSADANAVFTSNIDPFFPHLSFVRSHNAHLYIVCTYTVIGSLSVFIWDILCHLRDDYQILFQHRSSLPTFVYFLSRLFTLLCLIGYSITQTTPLGHCDIAIRLVNSSFIIALPASELLLFLHVRAIYATERIVVWFFTLLWLCTFVSAAIAVVTVSGIQIGPTNYCVPAGLARINIGAVIIPLVNDTLLFIALVARILGTSTQDTDTCHLKDRIKMVLFGVSIPRLAKTLLQNGQQYFSATVFINLAALVLYYVDGENPSLGLASIMLMNLMASRLYRKTKLTKYDGFDLSFQLNCESPPCPQTSIARSNSRREVSNVLDRAPSAMPASSSQQSSRKSRSSETPALASESSV